MTVLGKDSLLDTAGVAITSHTPSGSGAAGGTWTPAIASSYVAPIALAGGGFTFTGANSTPGSSYLSGTLNAAPNYVKADITFTNITNAYPGLCFVLDDGPDGLGHNYNFQFFPGSGANTGLTLNLNGSSGFFPAAVAFTPVVGQAYTFGFERTISGGTITLKGYIDGVLVTSYSDTTYVSGMYGGFCSYSSGGHPNGKITNFEAGSGLLPSVGPTAGTLAFSTRTATSTTFTLATNTTGTGPYSNQLTRSPSGAGTYVNVGSPVVGATATLPDTTVVPGTAYDYRVTVTDALAATGNSNVVADRALIPSNNSNIFLLGQWNVGLTSVTITDGSIIEFKYNGTNATLYFDTSTSSGARYPVLACSIDGGAFTRTQLGSGGTFTITQSAGVHTVKIIAAIDSGFPVANTNWTTQTFALKFRGLSFATTGAFVAASYVTPQIEYLGDSITAGLRVLYVSTNGVIYDAPEQAWPYLSSTTLNAKPVVRGHGGIGFGPASTDGTTAVLLSFPYLLSGVAYTPAIQPQVVIIYIGVNDTGSLTLSNYQTYLTNIRAARPDAYILAINPYATTFQTPISGAVTAMADSKIIYKDYAGKAFISGDFVDGTHLSPAGNIKMAGYIVADIENYITGTSDTAESAGDQTSAEKQNAYTGFGEDYITPDARLTDAGNVGFGEDQTGGNTFSLITWNSGDTPLY